MKICTGIVGIFLVSIGAHAADQEGLVVASAVATLVAPIINAAANVADRDTEEPRNKLEDALGEVLNKPAPESDEALAILLPIDIGAHGREDVTCEIIDRGQRILPYLKKYLAAYTIVPGATIDQVLFDRTQYHLLIARIGRHEQCARE